MRGPLLLALLVVPILLAGCGGAGEDPRAGLVPYPRLGDVATYELSGAYLEVARWENGHAFPTGSAMLRYTVSPAPKALDAARAVHPTFQVTAELNEGGGFVRHADHYVSPIHQAIVQSYYPHSTDQGTVSFDQRGYPWLFGASLLFGEDLGQPHHTEELRAWLPDNLGLGSYVPLSWAREGEERVDGVDATRIQIRDIPGVNVTLWMEEDSAWPVRARIEATSRDAAPFVRIDGPVPVVMDARRVSLTEGDEPMRARDRSASFTFETGLSTAPFDGEKPPDGQPGYVPYLLADAVGHAKVLDRGLASWLAAADDPRLYRATYIEAPPPAENVRNQTWLLGFMERGGGFYVTQLYRLDPPLLPAGVPLIASSGPADPPRDTNHGWFPADAVPEKIVPLSEGVRLVRDTFGAQRVEIFLRSFAEPPGYSYFIDGGFEGPGRYTVVVNSRTGLMENATGPVQPLLSDV